MMQRRFLAGLVLAAALAGTAFAAQAPKKAARKPAPSTAVTAPIQLDPSTIKGEQSLPKVLNIVPWKRASGGDLPGRPEGSLLDDVLAPLDRGELRRQIRYEKDLDGTDAAQADSLQQNKQQTKE